jgi:hypothetical protein
MKKLLLGLAVVASLGVYWLVRSGDSKETRPETPAVTAAGVAPSGPRVIYEDKRAPQVMRAAVFETAPVVQEERIGLGDTATLKFDVPREYVATGMGMNRKMTAKAFRGNDRPIDLTVEEVKKGQYQVPFTPEGPGQFNVVLSDDGTPIAARKVGVVGVVGGNALTDPTALDEADPISYRARTTGKLRSR